MTCVMAGPRLKTEQLALERASDRSRDQTLPTKIQQPAQVDNHNNKKPTPDNPDPDVMGTLRRSCDRTQTHVVSSYMLCSLYVRLVCSTV